MGRVRRVGEGGRGGGAVKAVRSGKASWRWAAEGALRQYIKSECRVRVVVRVSTGAAVRLAGDGPPKAPRDNVL